MLILKTSPENALKIFNLSIKSGAPIVFPTDTIYGVGAPVISEAANLKIYKIKKRKDSKPFPVLIGDTKQLNLLVDDISGFQKKVIDKLWPGPYTLIFKANNSVSKIYTLSNKIAIRLPSLSWLSQTINKLDSPITATSVNFSGKEHLNSIGNIIKMFKDQIPYYLYDFHIRDLSSTIIDISCDKVVFLRNPHNLKIQNISK